MSNERYEQERNSLLRSIRDKKKEIAYFMDTEARIMLAVKTTIGVKKVEE